jgi:hypothetical protein
MVVSKSITNRKDHTLTTQIFECVAGSHLFGTSTPASDTDLKGVHIPSAADILLQRVNIIDNSTGGKTSANTPEDVDSTSFPLQRYLMLLAKMETNAVEMLFAPNRVSTALLWQIVYAHRYRFLNANKSNFMGFGKAQANRYAVRGNRLETLTRICDYLASFPNQKDRLFSLDISRISTLDGVTFTTGADGIQQLSVFGRQVPLPITVGEALSVYRKPLLDAGKRSLTAMDNGGADWKGLYHAHRIIDEGLELFSTGRLTFPCKNSAEYLAIRSGCLPLEQVLDTFEEKLSALDALKPTSDLRETADMEFIDELVLLMYGRAVKEAMN